MIHRWLLAGACVAAALLAGCSSSGTSTPSACRNPYYPTLLARVGTSSTFAVTAASEHATRTIRIDAVEHDGCDVLMTTTSSFTGRPAHQAVYRVDSNGSTHDPTSTIHLAHDAVLQMQGATVPRHGLLAAGKPMRERLTVILTDGSRRKSFPQEVVIKAEPGVTVHVPAGRFLTLPISIEHRFTIGSTAFDMHTTYFVSARAGTVKIVEMVRQGARVQTAVERLIKLVHGGATALT